MVNEDFVDKYDDEHEENDENRDDVPPGMITVKTGLLVVVITSAIVFVVMALLTCVVAKSFRVKQKTAPAVMTDVRFVIIQ